ncbi:thiamine pyrophosphate-dependent dehydrogenase E1 component subunit alpha [Agrococcus sp. TSP3-2-1]|uniref:thiamine pyrophosphate-dependent dehydrogenase E1 component subunit alpha n=1 Tax=Agrococcus sp. TSP3-2-1 TaxID=2804583 RepID=UPI003CF2AA4F
MTLNGLIEQCQLEEVPNEYVAMRLVRAFEERAYQAYNGGEVKGSIHSSVGHEAIAAAAGRAFKVQDYIACTHRGHGHAITRGTDVGRMFAELMGKESGTCRGRGGSMHLTDKSVGLIGANGIVGASVELAVGAAMSIKTLGDRSAVAIASFGDGATAQGSFHEGMNLASLWKLPVVFLCENNQYAVTAHVSDAIAAASIVDFAEPYKNVEGIAVDGRDYDAVAEAMVFARQRAVSGGGPVLIEAKTYRFMGHSRGDPAFGAYRSKEAHLAEVANDPIERFIMARQLPQGEIVRVNSVIAEFIERAIDFGRSASEPAADSALEYVY